MRFTAWIIAIALAALAVTIGAAAPARAGEPVASTSYTTDIYGLLTVKTMVNGEGPYNFIIDTGATTSLIFQNLADRHQFQPSDRPPQVVFGLAAQGAFTAYDIGELRVGATGAAAGETAGETARGSVGLDNLASVILPDWAGDVKPQGILGLDFLTRYILVFNAVPGERAGRLDIYAPGDGPARSATRGWRRIKLTQQNFGIDVEHDLFTAAGLINDTYRMRFMIDLGASGSVINRAVFDGANRYRVTVRKSATRVENSITGVLERDPETALTVRAPHLRIGRNVWRRQVLTLFDAPIFAELGMQETPFGLFGADLVRERSFMLNLPGEEMRIARPQES